MGRELPSILSKKTKEKRYRDQKQEVLVTGRPDTR